MQRHKSSYVCEVDGRFDTMELNPNDFSLLDYINTNTCDGETSRSGVNSGVVQCSTSECGFGVGNKLCEVCTVSKAFQHEFEGNSANLPPPAWSDIEDTLGVNLNQSVALQTVDMERIFGASRVAGEPARVLNPSDILLSDCMLNSNDRYAVDLPEDSDINPSPLQWKNEVDLYQDFGIYLSRPVTPNSDVGGSTADQLCQASGSERSSAVTKPSTISSHLSVGRKSFRPSSLKFGQFPDRPSTNGSKWTASSLMWAAGTSSSDHNYSSAQRSEGEVPVLPLADLPTPSPSSDSDANVSSSVSLQSASEGDLMDVVSAEEDAMEEETPETEPPRRKPIKFRMRDPTPKKARKQTAAAADKPQAVSKAKTAAATATRQRTAGSRPRPAARTVTLVPAAGGTTRAPASAASTSRARPATARAAAVSTASTPRLASVSSVRGPPAAPRAAAPTFLTPVSAAPRGRVVVPVAQAALSAASNPRAASVATSPGARTAALTSANSHLSVYVIRNNRTSPAGAPNPPAQSSTPLHLASAAPSLRTSTAVPVRSRPVSAPAPSSATSVRNSLSLAASSSQASASFSRASAVPSSPAPAPAASSAWSSVTEATIYGPGERGRSRRGGRSRPRYGQLLPSRPGPPRKSDRCQVTSSRQSASFLERGRRQVLRQALHVLRELVPCSGPCLTVLHESRDCILRLVEDNTRLEQRKTELAGYQEALHRKLDRLKAQIKQQQQQKGGRATAGPWAGLTEHSQQRQTRGLS